MVSILLEFGKNTMYQTLYSIKIKLRMKWLIKNYFFSHFDYQNELSTAKKV